MSSKVLTNGKHTVTTLDPSLKSAVNTALLEGGYIPQMQAHLSSLLLQPLPTTSTSTSSSQSQSQSQSQSDSTTQQQSQSQNQHTLSSLITSLTLEKLRASLDNDSVNGSSGGVLAQSQVPTHPNLMNAVRKEVKAQIPEAVRREMIEYVRGILEEVVEVRVDAK